MELIKKIQGLYNPDKNPVLCTGEIKIFRQEQKVFYASWHLQDEKGANLGGRTRNYYVGCDNPSKNAAIELILANIKKYRVGRKKAFSEIEIIS